MTPCNKYDKLSKVRIFVVAHLAVERSVFVVRVHLKLVLLVNNISNNHKEYQSCSPSIVPGDYEHISIDIAIDPEICSPL
jgi:hypothetical protein